MSLPQNWDKTSVYHLVTAFVAYIPSLFEGNRYRFLNFWLQSGKYYSNYMESRRKNRQDKVDNADRFKLRVEVSSLLAFLYFAQEQVGVPKDSIEDFRDSLLRLLMPGCIINEDATVALDPTPDAPPVDSTSAPEVPPVPPMSPQEIFEQMLQALLKPENLVHFYPLPDKNGVVWPTQTEDGTDIWGYIKRYDWGNDGKDIPCLVLIRDYLVDHKNEWLPQPINFKDVLTQISKEKPHYLHSTLNARVKWNRYEKSATISAYRLNIAELPIDSTMIEQLTAIAAKCIAP